MSPSYQNAIHSSALYVHRPETTILRGDLATIHVPPLQALASLHLLRHQRKSPSPFCGPTRTDSSARKDQAHVLHFLTPDRVPPRILALVKRSSGDVRPDFPGGRTRRGCQRTSRSCFR